MKRLRGVIGELVECPPLSKFGLDVVVDVVSRRKWATDTFQSGYSNGPWYRYDGGRFHSYGSALRKREFLKDLDECEARAVRVPATFAKLAIKVVKPCES